MVSAQPSTALEYAGVDVGTPGGQITMLFEADTTVLVGVMWPGRRGIGKLVTARVVGGSRDQILAANTWAERYWEGQHVVWKRTHLKGTSFQQQVWARLSRIPYGSFCTYSDIAHELGCPQSVRAVANAVASNPAPVVIPCHRVGRTDLQPGSFSGGLTTKLTLLAYEAEHTQKPDARSAEHCQRIRAIA